MPEYELTVSKTDDAGRTYYEPVVATVKGYSEYNKDQISLITASGRIKGYWSLAPKLREKMGIPPIGTKAEWYLATKPKTSEKARPGSLYYDVLDVRAVPDTHVEPTYPAASEKEVRAYHDDRTASIVQQVAFKALTDLLAQRVLPMYFPPVGGTTPDGVEEMPILTDWGTAWVATYQSFACGEQPQPAEPEPTEGAQAARTDAELGDEDLPWSDGDGAKAWPATQPEMQTGAAVKKASH